MQRALRGVGRRRGLPHMLTSTAGSSLLFGTPCGSLAGCSALGGLLQTVDVALVDLKLPEGEGSELVAVLRGPTFRSGY